MKKIKVIDSHTAGEPTRIVVGGLPDLGSGSMAERLERFKSAHDSYRSAVVNEPRGSEVLVGGLLQEPVDPQSCAGVIFFNNVGTLGMCGHGTIGLVTTLAYLGRIQPGRHRIETPVGPVTAELHADGSVSVRNVPSYRKAAGVEVDVPGLGRVRGDVAWGGNWFFLVYDHHQELQLSRVEALTQFSLKVRSAVNAQGFPEVDHVELFGRPSHPKAHSRNFVLCPGGAYDRSPCGTGTSAKLACLFEDGKLQPGQLWRQESILGTCFDGSIEKTSEGLIPTIRGSAFITAEAELILQENDPFSWGIVTGKPHA